MYQNYIIGTDDSYNSQFWNKLQAEWKKLSENEETEHPWLSEYSEYYDSFKVGYLRASFKNESSIFCWFE